ncbi:hypothetical protein ZHAS_00020869 [Anopheles sinensis]|uniref:Uncharacterized protein n=1 Tax=Anopheles sinensis TaxID=74873 RepID=A0A084WQX5_ANOSI|nr:hypothetical protein ZHAS_00020869 [Anopheles sinensis]
MTAAITVRDGSRSEICACVKRPAGSSRRELGGTVRSSRTHSLSTTVGGGTVVVVEEREMEGRKNTIGKHQGHHWPWSRSYARDSSVIVGLVLLLLLQTIEVISLNNYTTVTPK